MWIEDINTSIGLIYLSIHTFSYLFYFTTQFIPTTPPISTHKLYELGIESIPSESECYPAKLAHGHIKWLINQKPDFIFYPALFYERKEFEDANDHYNCPIVTSYSENIKNNVEEIGQGEVRFRNPFMAFTSPETIMQSLEKEFAELPAQEIANAIQKAGK